MKKSVKVLLLFFGLHTSFFSIHATAQQQTENLIIVTLDGMRWQEVFTGADKALLSNKRFTQDSLSAFAKYWNEDPTIRRKKIFPFLWSTMANNGQLLGNRNFGNKVNNANPYKFSYPGYNEIFTGYPDTLVNSNNKILNKNTNVLEFIHQQPAFNNKVAAFTTWDVFPYILNKGRSGLYVNSDHDTLSSSVNNFQLLNDFQRLSPRPIGVRPDVITYLAAKEYLKTKRPSVLYIAFDETDDFAHGGQYNQYLLSAGAQDQMIADLWNWVQSEPGYKGKTTLIVTCDHGRGDQIKENWRNHGANIPEAGEIWVAIMGPDTAPAGERKDAIQLYQKQLAATFAKLLGLNFTANHPVADPIESIIKNK
jgi:Type I phosphodiesterase / nucleotide pyrophosphatase